MVTVFRSILNQMELHLVQNRKENSHHDYIPFSLKGNGNIVLSVRAVAERAEEVWEFLFLKFIII